MMRIASTVGPVGASMVQPALAAAWIERHVQRAQVVAGRAALEDVPICQQMQ